MYPRKPIFIQFSDMHLVLISDTHGQHRSVDLPVGDVLIHSGDLTLAGERDVALDFVSWLAEQPFRHKIFVAGNHDNWAEHNSAELRNYSERLGVHYLQDSSVDIDGVRFWGSPYTPEFMDWSFMLANEATAARHWQQMPDNVDVVITHGPPAGVLDELLPGGELNSECNSGNNGFDTSSDLIRRNVGCRALAARIAKVSPRIHIFGHIHEAYGSHHVGGTHFINASCMNTRYELANPAHVVSLDEDTISVFPCNTYSLGRTLPNASAAAGANANGYSVSASDFDDRTDQPVFSDVASR